MPSSRRLIGLALASVLAAPSFAAAQGGPIEEILIVAKRDQRTSEGATGLALDILETPQSISVVDRELMDTFGATDINAALDLATGIRVERWETNRTNYVSRGFEIKNTQIDGVGLPNDWGLVTGALDAFGYEKIEIIRGANGLLTGVGNASGTINYVRKRPTNSREGSIRLSAGSWDRRRLEADFSTPLTDSGGWAGRLVAAGETSDSYLRGLENERAFVYGTIDGQLTERSTLAVGYSFQDANTDGNMWGGLVFTNSDGTQAEWDDEASTSQDWTHWDTIYQTAFVEYEYALPGDWALKLSYNYRAFDDDSKLFFASTTVGLDPQTGAGLVGWPGKWRTDEEAHLFEASTSGAFELFGGTHDAILGVSHAEGESTLYSYPADPSEPAFGPLPPFPYPGDAIPEPAWGPKTLDSVTEDELTRYYGATRINFGRLSTMLGFNGIRFERQSTTLDQNLRENEISPYVGVTYALTDDANVYASYSDIYQPQDFYDVTGAYLDPTKGVNYEIGAKASWLDNRLLTTFALFKAKQKGLGTFAGLDTSTGRYYYEGEDVDSEGFEVEITGAVGDHMNVVLGYTALELEDENGEDIYTWVPRDQVNLAVDATLPRLENVALGVAANWQSDISRIDGYTGIEVTQDSVLLVDAFVRWHVTPRSLLQLNVNNVGDEKYITSLFEIGYYGAPRNVMLSYEYSF
ncbi:MAG TPA: TonB-dependent siderophore receptor [Pseudomonadales bacterium]